MLLIPGLILIVYVAGSKLKQLTFILIKRNRTKQARIPNSFEKSL